MNLINKGANNNEWKWIIKNINIVDLLLNADTENLERPSTIVELKRLSTIFGQEFKVMCRALTISKDEEIQILVLNWWKYENGYRLTGDADAYNYRRCFVIWMESFI